MLTSLALILALGVAIKISMRKLPVPGLLGLLVLGVVLGPYGLNWLDAQLLENAADIRMIALIVILLKAGLGLNRQVLTRVKGPAIRLGVLPCITEGVVAATAAHLLLGFSWPSALALGFVLAAVSPAVVVPSMLYLKRKGLGMDKGIPIMILAGASVDDVVAITVLTSVLGWAVGTGASIYWQVLLFPAKIFGGIALGLAGGWMLAKASPFILSHSKGYVVLSAFALAFGLVALGELIGVAGLLAVMACGFLIVELGGKETEVIVRATDSAWQVAQIFLFVLLGAMVDLRVAVGAGLLGLLIITAGLLGRSAGVFAGLIGSGLSWREKLFCTIAYFPKATVQAAVAGLPLAMGVAHGEVILAIAVLSIAITAPLGAAAIPLVAPVLLNHKGGKS